MASGAVLASLSLVLLLSIPAIAQLPPPNFYTTTSLTGAGYLDEGKPLNFICMTSQEGLTFAETSNYRYFFYKDNELIAAQTWQSYFVFSTTYEHTGVYKCQIEDRDQISPMSSTVSIFIVGPPTLTISPEAPSLGQSVTLTCDPPEQLSEAYTIAWFRDESQLSSLTSTTFQINSLDGNDEGGYLCQVQFGDYLGPSSETVGISLSAPPQPTLEIVFPDDTPDFRSSLRLACNPNPAMPAGLVRSSLYLNGVLVVQVFQPGAQAIFEGNALERDSGTYTCTFSSNRGESQPSNPVLVDVQSFIPPVYVDFGSFSNDLRAVSDNEISCSSNEYDFCTLYRNTERYLESGNCRFKMEHALTGAYRCSGSNVYGESPQSNVKVLTFLARPRVVPVSREYPRKGNSFSMKCETEFPLSTFAWYAENDLNTVLGQQQIFSLDRLAEGEEKRYRCRIFRGQSSVLSDYFLLKYTSMGDTSLTSDSQADQFQLTSTKSMTCFSRYATLGYTLFNNIVRAGSQSAFDGEFEVFTSHYRGLQFSCETSSWFLTSSKSDSDLLYVQAKGELDFTASSATATLGQRLELNCQANYTDPDITYAWLIYRPFLDNFKEDPDRRDTQTLIIPSVSEADIGLYVCQADMNGILLSTFRTFPITFSKPDAPEVISRLEVMEVDDPTGSKRRKKRQADGSSDPSMSLHYVLDCSIRALFIDSEYPFNLYKDGNIVKDVPYTDSSLFYGVFQKVRSYKIDLSDASNFGEYTCTAVNSVGESMPSETMTVAAPGPEYIGIPTISPNIPNPTLGSDILLTCVTSQAVEDGSIFWDRNFFPLLRNGRNLTLNSLSEEDSATYTCRVPGEDGKPLQSEPYFLPLAQPLRPFLRFATSMDGGEFGTRGNIYHMYAEGQDIFVKCVDDWPSIDPIFMERYTVPGRTFSLLKNGQQVATGDEDGVFQLEPLTIGQYNYSCVVNDRAASSDASWPLDVRITKAPEIITSPSPLPAVTLKLAKLTLTCDFEEPSNGFDVVWEKNGKEMAAVEKSIVIRRIAGFDEGVYTCYHKSSRWSSARSRPLLLMPYGKAATPQMFTTSLSNSVIVGESLTLYCLSSSSTSTSATLYFDASGSGNYVQVDQSMTPKLDDAGQILFTFLIKSVSASNFGNYACTMLNAGGQSNFSEAVVRVEAAQDPCSTNPCGDKELCVVTETGHRCDCQRGYNKINGVCQDIDECSPVSPCRQGTERCFNTPGSHVCLCETGYANNSGICVDVNECSTNPCGTNARCVNTQGSYECPCLDGFQLVGTNCEAIVVDNCDNNPCGDKGRCVNTDSGHRCECFSGYTDSPSGCVDINECENNPCAGNEGCLNAEGSYVCLCKPGFVSLNGRCQDINECLRRPCQFPEQCNNNEGSYSCDCPTGYVADATGCSDINECLQQDACPASQECTNTVGSFTCQCPAGLEPKGDECVAPTACSDNSCNFDQDCVETDQGYRCDCKDGFTASGTECADIDECSGSPCKFGERCLNRPGSYFCVCASGFQANASTFICEDINECDNGVCGDQQCSNTPGSYTCGCPEGFSFTGTECQDIDECQRQTDDCAAEQTCVNTDGSFYCQCKDGSRADADGNCPVVQDCSNDPCGERGNCVDTNTGFTCICDTGYTQDETGCVDVNECLNSPCDNVTQECINSVGSFVCLCVNGYEFDEFGVCVDWNECFGRVCTEQQSCENTPGSFICSCLDGYEPNGRECLDIDECQGNVCADNLTCVNTAGSFYCECPGGGRPSTGSDCTNINECLFNTPRCAYNELCVDKDNGFDCECLPGYTPGPTGCQDINECENNPCSNGDACVNSDGTYLCLCSPGFVFLNGQCQDIDECLRTNICAVGQQCQNSEGSFSCECPTGYQADGADCKDIDECLQQGTCRADQTCSNTEGSYSCQCPEGSVVNGGICVDANSCANTPCIGDQTCVDTNPGYRCECPAGYTPGSSLTGCVDVNECTGNPCQEGETCVNSRGSYTCLCPDGYESSQAGECVDSNECLGDPCDDNADCTNTEGSYVCTCNSGFTGDGVQCADVDECQDPSVCPEGQICRNNYGSFFCQCLDGPLPDASGNCPVTVTCANSPCKVNERCVDLRSGYRCDCDTGYRLDQGECVDINECDQGTDNCGLNSVCFNLSPNFECRCRDGYTPAGDNSCVDIDECDQGTDNCGLNSVCFNLSPNFECRCRDGYTPAIDNSCVDIDECDQGTDNCGPNSVCFNLSPNFECRCRDGYTSAGDNSCVDINECTNSPPICDQQCNNTAGSYVCSCNAGYVEDGPRGCRDIDECDQGTDNCGPNSVCVNLSPNFECRCRDGYTSAGDNSCVDVDECAVNNGGCQQICSNTNGSFVCSCNADLTLSTDSTSCDEILEREFQVTFRNIQLSDVYFNTGSAEYATVSNQVETQVESFLKDRMPSITDVELTSMGNGSLNADMVARINTRLTSNPEGELLKALAELERESITVSEGQSLTQADRPKVSMRNTEITASANQCDLRDLLAPCDSNTVCLVNNSVSQCVRKQPVAAASESESDEKYIYIGVGATLGVLLVISLVVAFCTCRKREEKKEKLPGNGMPDTLRRDRDTSHV